MHHSPTKTGHPPQATGCATEPRRDRSRADTNGGQAEPERGTRDAESDGDGAKGTETGREGERAQSAKNAPQMESRKGADQTHGGGELEDMPKSERQIKPANR